MPKEEKRGKKQRDKFIVHYIYKCGFKRNTEKRLSIVYHGFKVK